MKYTTEINECGLIVLGVETIVSGVPWVLQPGDYETVMPGIVVASKEDARDYLNMARAVENAQRENRKIARAKPVSDDVAIAAMARMMKWAEQPTKAYGLSHLGIHTSFVVNAGGVPLCIGAAPINSGVLFTGYGDYVPEGWLKMAERVKEARFFETAAREMGAAITDEWNDGQSTVLRCSPHPTVIAAFGSGEQLCMSEAQRAHPDYALPEGWR